MPKFRLNWSYSEVFEADDLEAAAVAARATMQLLRDRVELDGAEQGWNYWLTAVDAEPRRGVDDADHEPDVDGRGVDPSAAVREWHDEEGWGVIDSNQTPGGCWAHFSHVLGDGYKTLEPGQSVTVEWESTSGQDGYLYRAVAVAQN